MTSSKFNILYLHVGRHKTGTSALQKFFLLNEKLLSEKGVIYPDSGRHPVSGAHHDFFFPTHPRNKTKTREEDFDKKIDTLRPLANKNMSLLLSSEMLSEAERQRDVSLLLKLKKIASDLKVVLYLRRQDDYIESVYSQIIKDGNPLGELDIDELLKKEAFLFTLNYKKTCEYWSNIFGKENVIVRPYERNQFKNGSIFADFLEILDIDDTTDFSFPERSINPSLTHDTLCFKKYANKLITDQVVKRELQHPLIKMELEDGKVAPFQNHSLLSPSVRFELIKKHEDSNAFVAREYLYRKDGRLFYEHPPQTESNWVSYKGLAEKETLRIAKFISVDEPALFNVLRSSIQTGLKSNDEKVSDAAKKMLPVLSVPHVSLLRVLAVSFAKQKGLPERKPFSYYLLMCLRNIKACYKLFVESVVSR